MILESIDEIRAQGVTVYDYRTVEEKAQPLDVSAFDVPAVAKWIAADADGEVYPYSEKPWAHEGFGGVGRWCYSSHELFDSIGFKIGTIDMIGIDWRRTLTAVNVRQPAQPWCERCNLPEDICRGHEEITHPSPTVEAIVTLWQQLDGMQECDLAAAMVRADEHAAEGFHMALGMALEAVQSQRYVGEDKGRHARIWDNIEAQLRAAQ